MLAAAKRPHSRRKDDRIIIHFDYDAFYASVIEAENPSLRSLPMAVQQKQIIVTCNYMARERGLHKLQLISDAKRMCPDVVIILGEDLTRFRNASKMLYNTLRAFSWNDRAERLGFDEVWMDVTPVIDYNVSILNKSDPSNSFFHLSAEDPMLGFVFDATIVAGHTFPPHSSGPDNHFENDNLLLRLTLGSHLAMYLRKRLEEEKGYTSTVGIATNKMLSKLVGNLNKPDGQTTIVPPYRNSNYEQGNICQFLDGHDIGAIPWIGFKLAQKLREHFLGRSPDFENGLVYGPTREKVSVKQIRTMDSLSPQTLEELLRGPGSPHGIGGKVYALLHGIDDSEVKPARLPRQISIEDSYIRLDTMPQVLAEMRALTTKLYERMIIDLAEADESSHEPLTKWMAFPTTLRLTTRPRPPINPDGTRTRTFKRISRSCPMPSFVFLKHVTTSDHSAISSVVDRLMTDFLLPLFKKLHHEPHGWNLSLMNVAVTGMDDAGDSKDVGNMLKKPIVNPFVAYEDIEKANESSTMSYDHIVQHEDTKPYDTVPDDTTTSDTEMDWNDDEPSSSAVNEASSSEYAEACSLCGMRLPRFAAEAHQRFHALEG